MNSELERLKSEFYYKEQLVNMLRSTLVNMKNQRQTCQKWHHHQQQNNLMNTGQGMGVWHMAQPPISPAFQAQGPNDVGLYDTTASMDELTMAQAYKQQDFHRTQSPPHLPSQSKPHLAMSSLQLPLNMKEQNRNEEESKRKNLEELHKEVIFMESHIRILKDSLEDEKLENRDLIEENSLLKLQVNFN